MRKAVSGGLFRVRPRLRAYPARWPAGRPPDFGQAAVHRWTSRSYVLRSSAGLLSPAFLSGRLPPLLLQKLRFDEHVVGVLQLLLPAAVQPAEAGPVILLPLL